MVGYLKFTTNIQGCKKLKAACDRLKTCLQKKYVFPMPPPKSVCSNGEMALVHTSTYVPTGSNISNVGEFFIPKKPPLVLITCQYNSASFLNFREAC